MSGKWIVAMIVAIAAVAGVAMYYLQVYYFYAPVVSGAEVQLTRMDGTIEEIPVSSLDAIDASSSPIRFRGCFTTPLSLATLTETYREYETAEPLVAPDWFTCFDARALGAALEDGRALAFMGEQNIHYGIDRVIAVTEDGQGYAWHQINACGEKVFDGEPAPEGCPPAPEK